MQQTEQDINETKTWRDWLKTINWVSVVVLLSSPLFALYGILFVPLNTCTVLWTILFYFLTGFGITAGYHRLWSHKSYSATYPVRLFLMLLSSGAWQGSIIWWARNHRIHHRYTDQPQDPYTVNRGLFHAHFGWMLFHKEPKYFEFNKNTDISDLLADPLVVFQKKFYPLLALLVGVALPVGVAGLGWGDWQGGFVFASMLRAVFVHHATFSVNSLAHWLGDQPFSSSRTPRDHFITALVTLGEGYHNFHHEYPQDYRNATRWWQYDPTKWLVRGLSLVGLTYDLIRADKTDVKMAQWEMKMRILEDEKKNYNWGPSLAQLPVYDKEKFFQLVKAGEKLIIVNNIVHDIKDWIPLHPGGDFIKHYVGKDVSSSFKKGDTSVYLHSQTAQRKLAIYRVARLATHREGK